MHLLYVDESGGDDADSSTRNFVLGGICAFERVPYHLGVEVDEILATFCPDATAPVELRASAVWSGNGEPWESMPRSRRVELMHEVYQLLGTEKKGVVLFGIDVEKTNPPATPCVQRGPARKWSDTLMHTWPLLKPPTDRKNAG